MFGQMLDSIKGDGNSGISSVPSDVPTIITNITNILFGVAGIVLVFMIISSGYKFMTSAGDPKAMAAAQAKLTNAVLGIIIMFVSYWVVKLILEFFGINFSSGLF